MATATVEKKLTKQQVRKAAWTWTWFCLTVFGFERLQAPGMTMSMLPIYDTFYKDNPEEQKALLMRHRVFFNTEPKIGAMIPGIVLSLEEARANGAEVTDEFIQNIKVGLMGPYAGIGDAINQATVPPILRSICIGISGSTGSVIGPLLWIVFMAIYCPVLTIACFTLGYNLGTDAVDMILGERMARIQSAMAVMGLTVTGALTANYVKVNLGLTYTSELATVSAQGVLDGIFPKMLPVAVVMLGYWLLTKKHINAMKLMLIYVAIAVVGGLTGILIP